MQPERPNHSDDFERGAHYDCDPFEARLHEVLDARESPEDDAQLQRLLHAEGASSGENQRLLAGGQLLAETADLLDTPDLSAGFAERCVAAAMTPATPASVEKGGSGRRFSWGYVAISAVCVALLVIATAPWWSTFTNNETIPVVVEDDSPSEVAEDEIAPPEQDVTPALPETDIASDDTPSDVSDQRPNVSDVAGDDSTDRQYEDIYAAIRDLSQRIPNAAGEEDLLAMRPQWVDEFATGLRPVADSVGGAINVLRRNIPPVDRSESGEKPQARSIRLGTALA